jgi:hypothetical protein
VDEIPECGLQPLHAAVSCKYDLAPNIQPGKLPIRLPSDGFTP